MNFKNLFTRERKASATAPMLVTFGANQPRPTPRDYAQLAEEGYRRNVIVYRCVRLIAESAAGVPLMVMQDGHRVEDHPILPLLTQPNPMQSRAELFEAMIGFYLISGNCYVEAVGPQGQEPRELWTLRPDRMRVMPGKSGVPEVYRYSVNGKHRDFYVDPVTAKSPVLHIKTFHPLDDWYGMSPLEAAGLSVDQHNDAGQWNAALLQSGGRPSGALIYRPGQAGESATLTDEQRALLKHELESHFTGANNAGRPLVLEGGLDWREMSISPKDMDWTSGKDMAAREIAMAFHVPPQLIGVEGSLTFANFEQARLALYDDAILPLLNHICEELNNWLLPMFGSTAKICVDLDKVEALGYRRDQTWQRIASADFLTPEEKRNLLGL